MTTPSFFQRLTIATFILLFVTLPLGSARAQVTALSPSQAALLAQIEVLLQQIQELQALLAARAEVKTGVPAAEIYKSRFLNIPFEAVYAVGPGGLTRLGGKEGVRVIDAQLFNLFTAVVGEEVVRTYVDDFRVFYGDRELSAFVETKADSDKWFIAVNRFGYEPQSRTDRAIFIDLFLHEYAHMLLLEKRPFVKEFGERFWTAADLRHSEQVAGSLERFEVMEAYYDENQSRFVSDYATMSVDEDVAETFVEFVIKDRPTGRTILDQKVQYFYSQPGLVAERARLRANLVAVGVVLQ